MDAKGDVFVADSGDNVVREITAAGVIRRFAGTGIAGLGIAGPFGFPATLSSLDYSQDVAVDAHGNVFIADTYNNRVVKVTPQGLVVTVAGNGVAGYSGDGRLAAFAELNQPAGVAVDAQGNLYIADSANNVIRRVDAKTGIITTVAGDYAADKANDGLGGFSGDGGPATSAQLNDPQGVALDGAGDLFIADTFNNAIREVTPAGVISTVVNAASANGGIPAAGGETQQRGPDGVEAEHPVRGRASTRAPTTCTSPTPTTARSPRSPAWPSPAARPARPLRLTPDAPATRRRRDIMTDKHKHSFGLRMNRRSFVASAAAVAGAAGLAGVLPENLARAATREPQEVRPVPGQAPGLPDAGKPQLRPLLRHLPRRPGIQRPDRDPAAHRPVGLPAARPGQPRRLPRALAHVHHHHRRRRASRRCRTTGATSTPPGTRARWTAGCSPTSPPTATPTARSPWATTTEEDIPFHWALAKAFTLADNYHCSVMGPTDPNRLFWEMGSNDPQGKAGGPVLETGGVHGPDLRNRATRRSSTPGSAQVLPRQRLDRPHRRQLLQAVPDPRAGARPPCSTP